jgi:hypothetical protein
MTRRMRSIVSVATMPDRSLAPASITALATPMKAGKSPGTSKIER